MGLYKNTAGQRVPVLAINKTTGDKVDGDEANISIAWELDGVAQTAGTVVASSLPGVYYWQPSQANTNGDSIVLSPTSSTADVVLDPVSIQTTDVALFKTDVSALALEASVQQIINTELPAQTTDIKNHGDTNWLTATGFSTHSANDVWTAFEAFTITAPQGSTYAETLITAKLNTDTIISTGGPGPWTTGAAGGDCPTVEEIDAELTAKHGEGSWQTGGGAPITVSVAQPGTVDVDIT